MLRIRNPKVGCHRAAVLGLAFVAIIGTVASAASASAAGLTVFPLTIAFGNVVLGVTGATSAAHTVTITDPANCHCHLYGNIDGHSYCDRYRHRHSDGDCNCHGDCYCHRYGDSDCNCHSAQHLRHGDTERDEWRCDYRGFGQSQRHRCLVARFHHRGK